jgi:hypothetical protein
VHLVHETLQIALFDEVWRIRVGCWCQEVRLQQASCRLEHRGMLVPDLNHQREKKELVLPHIVVERWTRLQEVWIPDQEILTSTRWYVRSNPPAVLRELLSTGYRGQQEYQQQIAQWVVVR